MDDCPQCGEPTETLHEGYCHDCCEQNQRELDEHNFRHDWWGGLTAAEREAHIKNALRQS